MALGQRGMLLPRAEAASQPLRRLRHLRARFSAELEKEGRFDSGWLLTVIALGAWRSRPHVLMYAVSLEHQGRGRAIRKELQGAFMKGGKVIFTEGVAFMLARSEGGRCIADDSIDHPFWRLLVRGHPFDSQLPGVERRPLPKGKGVSP